MPVSKVGGYSTGGSHVEQGDMNWDPKPKKPADFGGGSPPERGFVENPDPWVAGGPQGTLQRESEDASRLNVFDDPSMRAALAQRNAAWDANEQVIANSNRRASGLDPMVADQWRTAGLQQQAGLRASAAGLLDPRARAAAMGRQMQANATSGARAASGALGAQYSSMQQGLQDLGKHGATQAEQAAKMREQTAWQDQFTGNLRFKVGAALDAEAQKWEDFRRQLAENELRRKYGLAAQQYELDRANRAAQYNTISNAVMTGAKTWTDSPKEDKK